MFKKILDILFPIECVGCGFPNFLICDKCFETIQINSANYFSTDYVDEVHVCCSFHNRLLQRVIHLYKYQYIEDLSRYLSLLMISYFLQTTNKILNPIIIPVPLHKKRLIERCFNQSYLIADNFCKRFDYVLKDDLIIRVKNTKQQAKLNKEQRIDNIKNSFCLLNKDFIQNKNFIIIDDIYTTGSTVSEIAKLLKTNGANKIWCIVIGKN
ncbi:MAG: phosphoribosyltransferase family protein [Patescibacteria group bacterium]|nr:phosphoribosyltransferase family protein [Patescibacteria group bacterium]MDD4304726.1 phosphoribosyltransferase family protein [Patescibacteria group bacterium]MDD4695519.1 phosphoribosyltransferase family protein [Patescibacteria group bacterium]